MTTIYTEKHILTLEEAQELGLPEELITDLRYGAQQRESAAFHEETAARLKEEANAILEPALKLLGVFAAGWVGFVSDAVGEVKSVQVDGHTFSRVVNTGRTSLNKDKMKEYLVAKGVNPALVMEAIDAGTSTGSGYTSIAMTKVKEGGKKD